MIHYAYPGSFCPPTYGHLRIVERAAVLLPHVTIVCSRNEEKNGRWFDEIECKALWSGYNLPPHVSMQTLTEFQTSVTRGDTIVLIRGIRNSDDFTHEHRIMELNRARFGISTYMYFVAEPQYADVSSSRARRAAENLDFDSLATCVHPMILSKLLEHTLGVKNIFLVVGKPGSGKSTFLRMLRKESPTNFVIETDSWSERFKPILKKEFGTEDLIALATSRDAEVSRFLKKSWLECLVRELRQAPRGANIFVEAAYGLAPKKSLFRFIGGKIIDFECGDRAENSRRIMERGTPEHLAFLDRIPDRGTSLNIAKERGLNITHIDTSCTLGELKEKVKIFNNNLKKNEDI